MPSIHSEYRSHLLPDCVSRILPPFILEAVLRCGISTVEEIRLRCGGLCCVVSNQRTYPLGIHVDEPLLRQLLQKMCGGSLYAYGEQIQSGYLALGDGVRVGICGSAATEGKNVIGVGQIHGFMIRIPHMPRVNAAPIAERLKSMRDCCGLLIYAPPGIGKTTLLRATAALYASPAYGKHTVIVDTRGELGYLPKTSEHSIDILSGYPRERGIEIAVRSLGAQLIVCDEIGSAADADAICAAANCGVPILASAHAASVQGLLSRPALRKLHDMRVFGVYVGLERTQSNTFLYRFTDWKQAECARYADVSR